MTGGLEAAVRVARESFDLEVDLCVGRGEVVALLGPNGAGKSTTLRTLAGLLPLRSGYVRLDGKVLEDPGRRLRLPAERRPVGVVFQDYLLFPHLSARDNVAFGLRARGTDRRTARETADRLLADVSLTERAGARATELSGGEAQRVALARALAVSPSLLLLDEPLAALDASTRMAVRGDLRRQLAAFAGVTVLVTHDALDALVLADSIVVVERGRVVQSGPPHEVASRPRTDYVANLVGLNLLAGSADGALISLGAGGSLVTAGPHQGPVLAAIRPSAVALYDREPHGSPRNVWPARVVGMEPRGDGVRVSVAGPPDLLADVTAGSVAQLGLAPGTPVWCAVKATEIDVYPA